MGDAGDGFVVFGHGDGDGFSAADAGEFAYVGEEFDPVVGDEVASFFAFYGVVVGDGPGRAFEEAFFGGAPAGVFGAGHGVAADVAYLHVAFLYEFVDSLFHADDVGDAAVRRVHGYGVEDVGDGVHGYGDDDEGVGGGGAGEDRGEVVVCVKAFAGGGADAGFGVGVAEDGDVFGCEVAHDGSADES